MNTESRKVKLPKLSKIDKAKKICEQYSKGEHTISTCCNAVGIKYETFKQWAQSNLTENDIKLGNYRRGFVPVVHYLYKRALESKEANYKALLKDATKQGILKRLNGITVTETETVARYDEYGNLSGLLIKKTEKYIAPDPNLLIFVIKCLNLFSNHDKSSEKFISTLKNQLEHLTIEELKAKRLELESILINDTD